MSEIEFSDLRILVVDPSTTSCRIVCNYLIEMGVGTIHSVEDFSQAVGKLRRFTYDLVVTDIMRTTDYAGLGLASLVQVDESINHAPVLVMLNDSSSEEITKVWASGAVGYIVKTFGRHDLEQKMLTIFSKSSALA